ncbi:MAG: AmmeMemoRadiSam system protein B [bacterium]
MSIVYGAIMPHPPIIVPQIGKERLKQADKTRQAVETAANHFKKIDLDTIVVITPHGDVGQASVPVYTGHVFEGDFSQFNAAKVAFSFKGDPTLALATVKDTHLASASTGTIIDHGVMVPMSYVQAAKINKPVLPIAVAFMPLKKLFEFGQSLTKTADRLGRKIAVIASADMSHRLTQDAPSGYSPKGKEFDEKLVELVKNNDVEGILNFDPTLADEAGQDALWSIAILLGAIAGQNLKPNFLSYEGPFGVGYMVATYE